MRFFSLPEELEEEKVAVVSLYPGIVKTEKMVGLMTKSPKDFEANVRRAALRGEGEGVTLRWRG